MALNAGARIGPYEVVAAVGAGGMGEVYRARDTRLGRDVALKVLPESFAAEPERLARFQREAQVLAALKHPNIGSIYGLEENALVLELIDGETLAERIAQGPIPIEEALPIARQIADALEAAHEQGIVHRDLKPANIKLTPGGQVKVLDFGLAKLNDVGAGFSRSDVSMSPTISIQATYAGVILGTAAYMSPEQARGKAVDRRADIWAFGCVFYEMLTGKQAFDPGETVSDAIAAVLTKEPDWNVLPGETPPNIRALMRRSLAKDVRNRIGNVAAVLVLIDEAGTAEAADRERSVDVMHGDAVGLPSSRPRALFAVGTALIAGLAIAGGTTWYAMQPMPPRVVQLAIATAGATALTVNGAERDLAITPDGSRVVYVGNGGRDLFVRALDTLEPVRLFTGAPRAPFVAPDGQWVGFTDNVTTLKKVAITGGPAVTLTRLDSGSRGAVWLPDDTIIFATANANTGLQQIAASGGPAAMLTRPDLARGERDHAWPETLPGGRAVLFTIVPATAGAEAQIAVLDLQTHTQTPLVRGGSHAHYVNSGHLVYVAGGTLFAVPFNPTSMTAAGAPTPVISEVVATTGIEPGGGVDAAIAVDGTLAYIRGTGAAAAQRRLVWVDRTGAETPIAAAPRAFVYPRISPAEDRVAVNAADQDADLWVWDVARLTLTRLTFVPSNDLYPVWTPDGRRMLFSSTREGLRNLFAQAADGTGSAERLTTSDNIQNATAVTPDGGRLIFTETAPRTGDDVMQVALTEPHTVTPLVQTPVVERNGTVSPDGRWLAYEANDSGTLEIYVRPYPDIDRGRWQVSAGGGTRPLWSRDGRELFYVSSSNALMNVVVDRGASWRATVPTIVLKDGSVLTPAANVGRTYDVAADGRRFLVLREASNAEPELIVIQHFDEMLKRLTQ